MNTLVTTVCRFVFRKRFLIPLALLIIGIALWQIWYFVPIPKYVPQDDQWKLVSKETIRPWGYPCVYTRFEVAKPQSIIAIQLKKIIFELYEWREFEEGTSENIIADVRADMIKRFRIYDSMDSQGKAAIEKALRQRVIGRIVPYHGWKFALRTELPFVFFSWHRTGSATHHYISVRLIDTGDNKTTVELWDFTVFNH
ncbi:MAG: hypothetical protein FVQ79_08905 [Planctomycetes bacterium]|nr:hypothetical protein [Planctomycetota bacterium]